MRNKVSCVLMTLAILGLIGLAGGGCRTASTNDVAGSAWTRAQAALLSQAGERLGVPVQTERMVHFAQAGAALSTAPAANLDTIPATELPRGVNVAVAYVDSPGANVPTGFYTVRAIADARQVGTIEGRVQLVDARGRVASESPASFDIQSMTIPDRRTIDVTTVSLSSIRLAGHCNAAYETCYCCTNGWIVCTRRLLVPRDIAIAPVR